MTRLRTSRRLQIAVVLIVVPFLVVAGFGVYLANMAGALPWQEEPTPMAAFVTPFANLNARASTGDFSSLAATATPSGSTTSTPVSDPTASAALPDGTSYAIVPAESEARYVVKETVGRLSLPTEAIGRTTAIRGQIVLDAEGRPLPGSEFEVDLRTLQSGEGQRDNFIQTVTLKDAPIASFVITDVAEWPGPLADGQTQTFTLVGEMTINGVTLPLVFETTASRTGDAIAGSAATSFTWQDFNLKTPNVAAQMISVEDTVRIELDITARAQ